MVILMAGPTVAFDVILRAQSMDIDEQTVGTLSIEVPLTTDGRVALDALESDITAALRDIS